MLITMSATEDSESMKIQPSTVTSLKTSASGPRKLMQSVKATLSVNLESVPTTFVLKR
ncbi:hypothetical protein D3C80_2229900 [compost metagenome]